jgi:hypothetical protein
MSNARPRLAEIVGQGAPCELSLRMTPRGPVLSLRGRSLSIRAAGELALEAETLSIAARGSASLAVGGALREEVGGAVRREVGGQLSLSASAVALGADEAIALRANDDVVMRGAQIHLAKEERDPALPGEARRDPAADQERDS